MTRLHVAGGSLGMIILLAGGGCSLFDSEHVTAAEDFARGGPEGAAGSGDAAGSGGAGAAAGSGSGPATTGSGNGASAGSGFTGGTGGAPGELTGAAGDLGQAGDPGGQGGSTSGSQSPPGEVVAGEPWTMEGKDPDPSLCVPPADTTAYCLTRPNFGFSSAGVDVNADGYVDLVVGAPFTGDAHSGAAYVFAGSADGLSLSPIQTVAAPAGDLGFAISVARAGDVNGDGFDDVIIGTNGDGKTPVSESSGRALLYLGSATGLGSAPVWELPPSCQLGCVVAGAGDVNDDGFDDVIIGGRSYAADLTQTRVFVYLGNSSGLEDMPIFTSGAEDAGSSSEFGCAVSGAGDLDGDGFDDVVVGAWQYGSQDRGGAYVYRGTAAGVATKPWAVLTGDAFEELGMSVASAGDVNGDGFDDLVTGGQAYDTGRVRLFLGGSAGLTASSWTTGSYHGAHVGSRAGDVNGDGYADVVVSYPPYEGSNTATVFLGSPSGLGTSNARFTVSSAEAHPQFGFDLSIAGDLNGDGYADVVVSAPYHDDSRGEVNAYLSAPAGLQGN